MFAINKWVSLILASAIYIHTFAQEKSKSVYGEVRPYSISLNISIPNIDLNLEKRLGRNQSINFRAGWGAYLVKYDNRFDAQYFNNPASYDPDYNPWLFSVPFAFYLSTEYRYYSCSISVKRKFSIIIQQFWYILSCKCAIQFCRIIREKKESQ